MNAAAAANTGRQRAASHNSGANSSATGPTVANSSQRWKMASALTSASAATASTPSMTLARATAGRARTRRARSSSGATVMMPSAVRREPVLPGRQQRRVGIVKQPDADGAADRRDGGPDDRRRDQARARCAAGRAGNPEPKYALDDPCREHRFAGIAQQRTERRSRDSGRRRDWPRSSPPSCRRRPASARAARARSGRRPRRLRRARTRPRPRAWSAAQGSGARRGNTRRRPRRRAPTRPSHRVRSTPVDRCSCGNWFRRICSTPGAPSPGALNLARRP